MKTATLPASLDAESLRREFAILSTHMAGLPLVYLSNAGSTRRPKSLIDAMIDCYRSYFSKVNRGSHTLCEESTRHYEQTRHANTVPWHQLAARVGYRVGFVPTAGDFLIANQETDLLVAVVAEVRAMSAPLGRKRRSPR